MGDVEEDHPKKKMVIVKFYTSRKEWGPFSLPKGPQVQKWRIVYEDILCLVSVKSGDKYLSKQTKARAEAVVERELGPPRVRA